MSLKTLIKAQISNTWWKVKYKYSLKYNHNWYLLNIIYHKNINVTDFVEFIFHENLP